MSSDFGGREGRGSGKVSYDLAAELRRIIMELDTEQDPETDQEEADSEIRLGSARDESVDPTSLIQTLKLNLEEASAESMIAIRLLHELVRLRHTELLNHLMRMEQNIQDEINLMERRVRGDIAALRTELGLAAFSEAEETTDESYS